MGLYSDEEDETAELLRELEKIKKERIEQREREVCEIRNPQRNTLLLCLSAIYADTALLCRNGKRPSRMRRSAKRTSHLVTRY